MTACTEKVRHACCPDPCNGYDFAVNYMEKRSQAQAWRQVVVDSDPGTEPGLGIAIGRSTHVSTQLENLDHS